MLPQGDRKATAGEQSGIGRELIPTDAVRPFTLRPLSSSRTPGLGGFNVETKEGLKAVGYTYLFTHMYTTR